MHRSELIRQHTPFYPHALPHADTSSCFKYLQSHDFGFVHKILCVERVHPHQVSSGVRKLGAGDIAWLEHLLTYGPLYLSTREFEIRKCEVFSIYYNWLGGNVLKMRGAGFWKYHTARLRELGYPIQWQRVIGAALYEIMAELRSPVIALRKLIDAMAGRNAV